MQNFKIIIFSIIALIVVGVLGYWAVVTIQSGSEYVSEQKIRQLEAENEDLKEEVAKLKGELSALAIKSETPAPAAEELKEEPKPAPTQTSANHTALIAELQKLVDAKVYLKEGSVGPRVGTVQKFLNVYNNTNNKIDNGYGLGTANLVEKFQRDMGLSPDGEAGPTTFAKMIEWLKKQ